MKRAEIKINVLGFQMKMIGIVVQETDDKYRVKYENSKYADFHKLSSNIKIIE